MTASMQSVARSRIRRARAGIALLALAGLSAINVGCSREVLSGPPELRLGRDECGECGMLINEDRCSSAMLIEREAPLAGRTRREYVMFDDIGCMLDYEHHRRSEFTVIDAFVHDHPTRQWLRAGDAYFLFADRERLPTPMGTGIVAFADRNVAEMKQREVGGDIMNYAALEPARREWMWSQYGRPDDGR